MRVCECIYVVYAAKGGQEAGKEIKPPTLQNEVKVSFEEQKLCIRILFWVWVRFSGSLMAVEGCTWPYRRRGRNSYGRACMYLRICLYMRIYACTCVYVRVYVLYMRLRAARRQERGENDPIQNDEKNIEEQTVVFVYSFRWGGIFWNSNGCRLCMAV